MDMKERLQELAEAAGKRISESEGLEKLNEVRVAYLGKKGELTAILKSMKDVAPEERPKVGQLVNEARKAIEEQLEAICDGDFTDEELENTKKSLCGGFKSNYDSIYDIMGWYAAQNTRNTAFTPEEINERIANLTREDIISCAKTFKSDTVFVIRGEEKEDCDE